MPTYVYRREDGTTFEIQQRITEDALTVDPETGQKVTRVISGAGLVFKGSGFYLTDYVHKGGEKSESKGETKGESKTESKAEASTESKPEKKAAPSSASSSTD